MTPETITRVIDEARRLLQGKEGLEEFLAEFETYALGEPDSSEAARLAYRLAGLLGKEVKDYPGTLRLLALINLKQGLDGKELGLELRQLVYRSAWERL